MRNLLLFAGILAAASIPFTTGAGIYKSVDEEGNVTFSDTRTPGAEEIEKKDIPTVPSRAPQADFSRSNDETGDEKQTTSRYDSIAIVSPEDDAAFRENSGQVSVSVSVQPALSEAHQIVLYMDGTEAARSRSPIFQFSNVDRGTHTLAAAVVGSDGKELIRSDSISFTLLRHSQLQPQADVPGQPNIPQPDGPTPANPPSGQPSGQNPVNPSFSGPTPTNPPKSSPSQ